MAHCITIVGAMNNEGVHGWLLKWSVADPPQQPTPGRVKLSHWYANVDEAMAVKLAMREGRSFEEAHAALYHCQLTVDDAMAARLEAEAHERTRRRASKARYAAKHAAHKEHTV